MSLFNKAKSAALVVVTTTDCTVVRAVKRTGNETKANAAFLNTDSGEYGFGPFADGFLENGEYGFADAFLKKITQLLKDDSNINERAGRDLLQSLATPFWKRFGPTRIWNKVFPDRKNKIILFGEPNYDIIGAKVNDLLRVLRRTFPGGYWDFESESDGFNEQYHLGEFNDLKKHRSTLRRKFLSESAKNGFDQYLELLGGVTSTRILWIIGNLEEENLDKSTKDGLNKLRELRMEQMEKMVKLLLLELHDDTDAKAELEKIF